MLIEDQLKSLRRKLSEPVNPDDARWTPNELLDALNEGRRWFAEKSLSFQVREQQNTNPTGVPTKFYTIPNDIIDVITLEWDGRPLDPIEPRDWRNTVGDDEDITGDPVVYKIWVRQIQLFFVPTDSKRLQFEGRGYPPDLAGIAGQDTQFSDQQARGGIWRAAWELKDADERDSNKEEVHARDIADQFFQQYKPKGPRFVRTRSRVNPILGFLRR